jgi:hypothetical protein
MCCCATFKDFAQFINLNVANYVQSYKAKDLERLMKPIYTAFSIATLKMVALIVMLISNSGEM